MSSVVKGSAPTKQREQKSSSGNTVQEVSQVPLPGLISLEENKKVQEPNGRLKLFVPVERQLHSQLLLCSGLHSVPRQESLKGRFVFKS